MHAPTCIVWANLTPVSLQAAVGSAVAVVEGRWLLHPTNDGKGYCDPSARIAHQLVIAGADACKQLCLQTESCNYACWQDQYGGQCHLTPACESFTDRVETTTWRKVARGEAPEILIGRLRRGNFVILPPKFSFIWRILIGITHESYE